MESVKLLELASGESLAVGFVDKNVKLVGDDLATFNKSMMLSRPIDLACTSVVPLPWQTRELARFALSKVQLHNSCSRHGN